MPNFFGKSIPRYSTILMDPKVAAFAREKLSLIYRSLGARGKKKIGKLTEETIRLAMAHSEPVYERHARSMLESAKLVDRIDDSLKGRSREIFSQVNQHLPDGKVLDNGCGDGNVGALLQRWDPHSRSVYLTDVYRHENISGLENAGLRFSHIRQGGILPFDKGYFDGMLLAAVLHHSDNPSKVLMEASRVLKKGGRLVVIESVHGIQPGHLKSKREQKLAASYTALSKEQQRRASIFFDHLYNRIFHYSEDPAGKVNLPHNLSTPKDWSKFFEKHGFREIKVEHNGFDHLPAIEYHTLHVLEKG
ncbi:MAG: class I SAM-dependent methyltransferase [Candidatus Micrarchaeota archaeon]